MKTNNKYVLITGGTVGIGYELAKVFAANQYNLLLVARTQNDLLQTQNELEAQHGIEVTVFQKDLFDADAAFELYEEVAAKNIKIDVLVNNAGQGHYGEFAEVDLAKDIEIIQLNITSLVVLTKLFLKDMLQRGEGKILNLSSVASKSPGPYQAVYHGTKAFVQSFSEAVRNEVKDKGITVTALLPGATDTDFFRKADMLNSKIVTEGRLDDPAKVAQDGFDALMAGDDMVISGFKNKMQVGLGTLKSDSSKAEQIRKQQEPATEKKS
ncbi:MAG: SDR family NAD(P)-dependent oxidoreductase [Agriterribacter sp.]